MLSKDKIDRINFLARKKKEHGLTPGETREQQILRDQYLKAVRGQVKSTLDNTKFVDDMGKELLVNHKYKHNNCGCGCGSPNHKHKHDPTHVH